MPRRGKQKASPLPYANALANPNAAAAASPPIATVCTALRSGGAPVNRPFTNPNTNSATIVTATDTDSPRRGTATKKYGARGISPPSRRPPRWSARS